MAYADELDPESSILGFFAKDLRAARIRADISQRDFAALAHVSPSLLNKVEAGRKLPSKRLAEVADAHFGRGDHFTRLWPLVIKYAYPPWFRPYVDLEASATAVRSFQVQVVPGLLQTEDYTRALLTAARLDDDTIADRLAARMERQQILSRESPPEIWVVLDENLLRRQVGGPEVMRGQFEKLMTAAQIPTTVIQVVPYGAGSHAGVDGPFSVLTQDGGPDVVAVEGFLHGVLLAEAKQVEDALRAYDLLTAVALSPDASVDLIAAIAKELAP